MLVEACPSARPGAMVCAVDRITVNQFPSIRNDRRPATPSPRSGRAARTLGLAAGTAAVALAVTPLGASAAPLSSGSSSASAGTAARIVNVSSSSGLQNAIKSAQPGDNIRLAAGTYSGPFEIKRSGTASAPITISRAGTGAVNLTASLRMPSCGASSPDGNRTVRFSAGASYWNIDGLTIRGGIMIMGGNAGNVRKWLNQHDTDWQTRRKVPGRGSYSTAGILGSTPYLQNLVKVSLKPSLGIKITNNVITLKGIHSAMNKKGVISGNRISDVACGTGPGIWLGTFSDGWTITGNSISRVAISTHKHYMQEGIRIGGSSAYNTVTRNTVSDLPGDGRAFTTDEDGSWNTFSGNTASNVAIGYNDQMSGWGNQWIGNRVNGFRTAAFSFRMMDSKLSSPSMNSSTYKSTVSCNTATGGNVVFQAGALMQTTVRNNGFNGAVQIGQNLRRYWSAQGNTWDGSSRPPGERVSETTAGC